MRKTIVTLALLASASPLMAQAKQQAADKDPTNKVAGGGAPAGWQIRLDDKDAKRGMTSADTKFVAMGPGYHVTSGPAALYYAPKDQVKGSYTVSATFTQTKAPTHPEAYGVFTGGTNLSDSTQQYLYFIVRGDGKYMINHRAGSAVHKVVDWTADPAVVTQDANGKATNAVAIRVSADSVHFLANGKQVKAFSKAEIHGFNLDGQAGLRVNHNLDVHVSSFEAK